MNGDGYLLDTNILIGLLKDHPPALDALARTEGNAVLAYSGVTRMELLGYPHLRTDEARVIGELLDELEYLPLIRAVEDRVINLRRHHRIKLPDAVIAATALERGYGLVTLDEALARVFSAARGHLAERSR